LAFRKGEDYVESLVGRQLLVEESKVELDPEYQREVEDMLLKGAS